MLALLASSPGCAYFDSNGPLERASAESMVAADIPVPVGFKLDKTNSWKHERSSFRKVQLVYRRAEYLSEERVREFFKTQYPQSGWELTFLWGLEETKMIFTKDAEECLVRIWEDFGDRYTQVEVQVLPRRTPDGTYVPSQVTAKKPARRSLPASAKR